MREVDWSESSATAVPVSTELSVSAFQAAYMIHYMDTGFIGTQCE